MSDDTVDWADLMALGLLATAVTLADEPVRFTLKYPVRSDAQNIERIASALRSAYAAGQREVAGPGAVELWAWERSPGRPDTRWCYPGKPDCEEEFGRYIRYVRAPEVTT